MDVREDDLVLRPDFRVGSAILAAIAVAAAAIVAAILIGDAPTVFAPIVGGVFAVLFLFVLGSLLRARIVLTQHELVLRGPFSAQHKPRAHIAEVIRARITAPRGATNGNLFVLDESRSLLLRIPADAYRREDLDLLVTTLDVPCSGPSSPINPKKFAETYPGILTKVEQHPYRLALATAAIIVTTLLAVLLVSLAAT